MQTKQNIEESFKPGISRAIHKIQKLHVIFMSSSIQTSIQTRPIAEMIRGHKFAGVRAKPLERDGKALAKWKTERESITVPYRLERDGTIGDKDGRYIMGMPSGGFPLGSRARLSTHAPAWLVPRRPSQTRSPECQQRQRSERHVSRDLAPASSFATPLASTRFQLVRSLLPFLRCPSYTRFVCFPYIPNTRKA